MYNSHTKLFSIPPLLNSVVAELYIIPIHDSAILFANLFIFTNVFLGVGTPHGCAGIFSEWRVRYRC